MPSGEVKKKHIRLDEFPNLGWSIYERLHNDARVAYLADEALNTLPLRDLDPDAAYTRQWGADQV